VSLLRPILRTCAVGALRDRTWAEARVFDSDQSPLAEAILGTAAKPYILVYTDTDDRVPPGGSEIYNGMGRQLSLAIEIGVASAIRNDAGNIIIQFAATDEGMELACDVIETQAVAALWGDPKSPWGDLIKRIVTKIVRMPSRRGGQGERGVRWAARRTVFVCSTIADIPPGVRPADTHPVSDFIRLARAHPELGIVDVATIMEKLFDVTQAPDWRVAQAYLGHSTEVTKNLVVEGTPLPWGDEHEVPVEEQPFDAMQEQDEYPLQLEELTLADDPWADVKMMAVPLKVKSPSFGKPGKT